MKCPTPPQLTHRSVCGLLMPGPGTIVRRAGIVFLNRRSASSIASWSSVRSVMWQMVIFTISSMFNPSTTSFSDRSVVHSCSAAPSLHLRHILQDGLVVCLLPCLHHGMPGVELPPNSFLRMIFAVSLSSPPSSSATSRAVS